MNHLECAICLANIKPDQKYTLSCNLSFHKECYKKCIFMNSMNIFINCPLCRSINYNNKRISDDPLINLKFLSPTGRCHHKTKEGKRCKNKSHILNYEYCYTHNKQILPKEKYEIMSDFIYWLFEANTMKNETKLTMIDIGKKLCMKYPEINKIQEILFYFYRFYHHNKKEKIVDKDKMYEYYDLEMAPEDWLDKSIEMKII